MLIALLLPYGLFHRVNTPCPKTEHVARMCCPQLTCDCGCMSYTSTFKWSTYSVSDSVLWPNSSPFKGSPPPVRNIPVSTQYLLALLHLLACASKHGLTTSPRLIWQIPNGLDSFIVGRITTQPNKAKKGEPNLKLYGFF